MKTSLSLLVLFLGLSQAQPLEEEESSGDIPEEDEDMDISTMILSSNNGSSEVLLEGDLVLPTTRNAMRCWSKSCLWRKSSNGHVMIPYTVNRAFSSSDKSKIQNAMQSFHQRTCLRFVPRRNQYDFISFENRDGCYSGLGKTGGMQVLSLNRRGCMHHGIIQHEINHALGFQHEQTRSDRDKADLWLMRIDFVFEFPRPTMPNVIYMGGVQCKPAKPLPPHLEDFVQSSGEHGVIIMSLGTLISSLPHEISEEIAAAFAKLPQKIIWRHTGHAKTKVFVAHGGTNGVQEAIYHGVPILELPLVFDQHDKYNFEEPAKS
ncbi:hypothetical protein NHX12_006028 [Muraenolepis orangiensis]|uniref:Peptidase M12A domain-containing protein n=1 Tax=Muraenolepis orangiensis TaxID=630683 RepID=A0A9Q0ICH5_9TELE|nr:hypothetical protein NHX12_006028 [Muraenolepis orangiensis]